MRDGSESQKMMNKSQDNLKRKTKKRKSVLPGSKSNKRLSNREQSRKSKKDVGAKKTALGLTAMLTSPTNTGKAK